MSDVSLKYSMKLKLASDQRITLYFIIEWSKLFFLDFGINKNVFG